MGSSYRESHQRTSSEIAESPWTLAPLGTLADSSDITALGDYCVLRAQWTDLKDLTHGWCLLGDWMRKTEIVITQ